MESLSFDLKSLIFLATTNITLKRIWISSNNKNFHAYKPNKLHKPEVLSFERSQMYEDIINNLQPQSAFTQVCF